MIPDDTRIITPGAARMRRPRERARQGDVIVRLKIGSRQITGLIGLGWLDAADRCDKDALSRSMAHLIERAIEMRLTLSGSADTYLTPLRATEGSIVTEPDKSVRPPSLGMPAACEGKPFEVDEVTLWRSRLDFYRRRRMWLGEWGPRPDQIGCAAPADLLAEFGLRPPGLT